jgi:membrane protein
MKNAMPNFVTLVTMGRLKGFWEILKQSVAAVPKDKIPKQSASLAYCTLFSIGPMLLVIIYLTNIFWGHQAGEGLIVQQLSGLVGKGAATQIQEIIKNASIDKSSTVAATIGFVTLFIGASTVFTEIQDTLNFIWRLQLRQNAGWMKVLVTRLLSFSIVISLAFLLLVSLIVNAVLEGLMGQLRNMFPGAAIPLIYILNLALTLAVTTILFGIIYKFLPDAHIRWKDVVPGSFFTAILFMLGKFGITFYITKSNVGSAYGAAGSIVVLLVWVYYSSIIMYFGAEFTKFYAMRYGAPIYPNSYTVIVKTTEVKEHNKSMQEAGI